jgi:holo-[acyl-carrier protein] synthase
LVKGIGVDLVKVQRITDIIDTSGEKFLNKLFTEKEIARHHSSSKRWSDEEYEYFASLFAAKESIVKAFGIGWQGMKGTDIEIRHDPLGAPYAKLGGAMAKLARKKGVGRIHLSLSSDSGYAVATCVLDE